MTDVFISYSRRDAVFVRRLADALQAHDLTVWVDWEGIPPTAAWLKEIYHAIEGADHFLFVLTPDSLRSEMCALELDHAVEHNKRLLPLCVKTVAASALPTVLASVQWLEITENQPFDEAVEQVVTAIHTDPETVRLHTRLLIRAVEWRAKNEDASLLLRGRELSESEQWLATDPRYPVPTELHREFVAASRVYAVRRRRLGLGLFAVTLIILAVLAGYYLRERLIAREQGRMALSRATAAQALGEQEQAFDRALLLAVAAQDISPTLEAESALQQLLLARPRLERILPIGDQATTGLAFSRDGHRLAAGLGDGSAVVWNLDKGLIESHIKPDGEGYVDAYAFDSNLRLAAMSGGNRKAITLRRLPDGEPVAKLAATSGAVQNLAFSPDGKLLVAAGGPKAAGVSVWNVAKARLEYPMLAVDSDLSSLAISPDGKLVAAGGWSSSVKLWDTAMGNVVKTLHVASATAPRSWSSIDGLALGPQPGWLAATAGSEIKIFDLSKLSEAPARIPLGGGRSVRSVAIDPAGQWLLGGSEDGILRLWKLDEPERTEESLDGKGGYIDELAFSPDSTLFAAGEYRAVHVYSTGGIARFGHALGRQREAVKAVAFSPDGQWVAAGGYERVIGLWSITGSKTEQLAAHRSDIRALAFSDDGKKLVSADSRLFPNTDTQAVLLRWNLSGARPALVSTPPKDIPMTGIWAMFPDLPMLRDDAPSVVLDGRGERLARLRAPLMFPGKIVVEVRTVENDQLLASLGTEHQREILAMALSGDGHRLATAGADGRFEAWDIDNARRLVGEEEKGKSCATAALNRDGSRMAVGCGRDLIVYGLGGTIRRIARLDGHSGRISALAFDSSGRRLAAADSDGGWILWDVDAASPVGRRVPYRYPIEAIAFASDGTRIATGDSGGGVVIWEITARRWRETACRIAGRLLSKDEYARYLPGQATLSSCEEFGATSKVPE